MEIVVFHGDGCPACHEEIEFLTEEGIEFTPLNVSKDVEARKRLIAMGSKTVPTTLIDGEMLVGYDLERLKAMIGLV